ncbi:MAG: hypothetical protein D6799_00590 [Bacteroidetes bacterium]|jgi:S-adenosylmethionine hydrolase|nr:MAG: hypothetical protein D6799_00590 [Bacteroidota bacterium]
MLPVILISDNTPQDIYNSVLKYHILSKIPQAGIFEYYYVHPSVHEAPYHAAAYILLNEHHFEKNTVFFVEINTPEQTEHQKILLIEYDTKWIFTPNNGITGLLEKEKINRIYFWKEYITTSFYAKNEMLNALQNLILSNFEVTNDFQPISYEECKKIYRPSITEKIINEKEKNLIVPALYIDSYQNLICFFKKKDYEHYSKDYDITIKLPLSEKITAIHSTYNQQPSDQPIALFNDAGYLEIAINGGHFSSLMLDKNIFTGISAFILLNLKKKN